MTWAAPLIGALGFTGSGGGNLTLTEPAGAQSGDLMIACIAFKNSIAPITAPAGWTALSGQLGASTGNASLAWFWLKRGASAPSYVFTRTGGTNSSGRVLAYRPSSGDFSFTASASGISSTNGTTHASGSGVTTAAAGDLVVGALAFATASVPNNFISTDPSGGSGATVDTATAPTAGQWEMRVSDSRSVSDPHALGVGDALRASAGDTGALVVGAASNTTAVVAIATFTEGGGGGGDTITVDEQPHRVYEGAAGSATITVTGSHTGATDSIEVQIEDTESNVIVAWATLDTAVAEGAFSGTVGVPKGGMYIAKVRKAGETTVTDAQATTWGVGYIVGAFGQSHLENMTTDGTGAPDARAFIHDGTSWAAMTSGGQGRNQLATDLIAHADAPVALILSGVSGTAISYWWSSGKTANYDAWEAKVAAAGGELSAFVLWQGDANAVAATSQSAYKAEIDAVFSQLRTDYGAGLPVVVVGLGRKGGGSDAAWDAIRRAHIDAGNDAGNYFVSTMDLPQEVDQQHFTPAGSALAGTRIARACAHAHGDATYSRGPAIVSAAQTSTTTVDVTLSHESGTDFTPTTGITGFRVLDTGTLLTISSVARVSATGLRITLSAAGTATHLQYQYGAYPDVSGAVLDNTAASLPLQPTQSDIAVSAIVMTEIRYQIKSSGTPVASEAGIKYALMDGTDPTTWVQIDSGTVASDASGWVVIGTGGTAPGTARTLVLLKTTGAELNGSGAIAPVVTTEAV